MDTAGDNLSICGTPLHAAMLLYHQLSSSNMFEGLRTRAFVHSCGSCFSNSYHSCAQTTFGPDPMINPGKRADMFTSWTDRKHSLFICVFGTADLHHERTSLMTARPHAWLMPDYWLPHRRSNAEHKSCQRPASAAHQPCVTVTESSNKGTYRMQQPGEVATPQCSQPLSHSGSKINSQQDKDVR